MLEGVQKRIFSFLPCKNCTSLPNTGSRFCEYFGVECFVLLLHISVVSRFESHFPTDWGSGLGSLWDMETPACAPKHTQCLCKHSLLYQSQSPGSSSILGQELSIELIPSSTTVTPRPCTSKIQVETHLHIPFSFPKPPPLCQISPEHAIYSICWFFSPFWRSPPVSTGIPALWIAPISMNRRHTCQDHMGPAGCSLTLGLQRAGTPREGWLCAQCHQPSSRDTAQEGSFP